MMLRGIYKKPGAPYKTASAGFRADFRGNRFLLASCGAARARSDWSAKEQGVPAVVGAGLAVAGETLYHDPSRRADDDASPDRGE